MKSYLIILGLFLSFLGISSDTLAYTTTRTYYYPSTLHGSSIYRPVYNPYGRYYNQYQYRRLNSSNLERLERLQKVKMLNRIRRRYYGNFLTWNNDKGGTLTGYSTPIDPQDVYNQMGISPYNQNIKQNSSSPTCDTDLFSSPQGDEMYYQSGRFHKDIGGASGKTGVTIIYD